MQGLDSARPPPMSLTRACRWDAVWHLVVALAAGLAAASLADALDLYFHRPNSVIAARLFGPPPLMYVGGAPVFEICAWRGRFRGRARWLAIGALVVASLGVRWLAYGPDSANAVISNMWAK